MLSPDEWVALAVVAWAVGLVVYCPIFKPWFGWRKPPGHPGRWGQ